MNTLKNSLRHKKAFTLILLGLFMSSLFGYVLPSVLKTENADKDEIDMYAGVHPLTGVSDNVVFCSNDNRELHEIYLCGADDERVLNLNITDLKQIVWSKLNDTSCSASQTNCPNTSPSCTWNQLATNTQHTITEGGEYRIFVQYNDNSTERFYFNVYANGLNPNAVVTNIDCATPGNITINNVPSSYEYSINNGASWQDSNVFPITTVSNYTVQLRNKNITDGCVFNLDDIAVNNNSINATSTILPITCNTSKGGIKIDLTDASSSYIYEIRQGGSLLESSGPITANTYTFTDFNSGSYDITVKLSSISTCSWNATTVIPSFVPIQPNAVVTKNIDCTDGVITVAPTGGTAPFEYSIDAGITYNAFTSADKTNINISTAGSYVIRIKDSSGCEIDAAPKDIITESEIIYTVNPKAVTCNGTDDGSVTVDITNSQGYSTSYSIDGTTFQTSNVFSNLASGSYTIVIKKEKAGGSCDVTTTSVDVDPSSAFTASASVTQQISCSSGSATIEAAVTTGGTAPFEYSTNGVDFQPSADLTGLGAGTYTITVKDANGCTTTVDQIVDAGSNPTNIIFSTSNVDCSTGATDVQLSIENGTGSGYTYQIISPSTISNPSDTFAALAPGTYTFQVDDDGCKINRNFTVPEPIKFTANTSVKKHVTCFAAGTADGEIEVDVTNFNTSFDVVVENSSGTDTGLGITGATTSPISITGLVADTYTIKISDASGPCEYQETQIVEAPTSALSLDSFNVSNMNCGSPGSVTTEASGGWGNYNYAVKQPDNTITPAQTNKTITGLTQSGIHTIILKDINGCIIDTETFDLTDNGGPTSIVDATASNYCYSTATRGELKIDVSDGEAPYFYTVNNGTPMPITGGTFTLSNLTPEDHIIKVIGSNGCETIVAETKISGQLFALAQITKPLGCGATPDAIINVTPEEGYPPYTYTLNGDPTPVTVPYSASTEGLYTFTVTDNNDCSFVTDPVDVKLAPALGYETDISPTACGKDGTGSVKLIAKGGTPPYKYAFSETPFSATNQPVYNDQSIFANLDATNYYFAIKDELGCEKDDIVELVTSEDPIDFELEKTDISCDDSATGGGGNVWGNMKIKNITNAQGKVTISLIRVYDKVKYAAGDETRTWVYRRYENIDLTSNSNYLNASTPARYGTNPGFDIRLYWASHFVVRVEDERGCVREIGDIANNNDPFTIGAPTFPNGTVESRDLPGDCADGASFNFTINDDPGLVGPFEAKIWPYNTSDTDGDGIDDNINNDWRPFDDTENPSYDPADPANERNYRFTNSALYGKLLFGVHYYVMIKDLTTGCIRWRPLGIVPPPNPGITVDAVPQSTTCYGNIDGQVQLTVEDYAPGLVTYNIYNASNPLHTSYHYTGTQTGTGAPLIFNVPNMRVAWYVVEVFDTSGCTIGERFLIYRPKSRLKIKEEQVVQPTCFIGGQVTVSATGGWDNQKYFNIRNKLDQASWHEYEYALVRDIDTPTDTDFGPNNLWTNVVPTAYDGVNNIYRAYVRDGGGCVQPIADPIVFTKDEEPVIDAINVTDRCTSTNELYNIVATLTQTGTNPINTNPVYIWDGEVTTSATKILGPGNHTLVVRDENGCSDTQNIHIYPQLVAKSIITKTVDCDVSGLDNGEMLASAYGGSGNFEFTISPIPASYAPGEETNTTGIFTRLEPSVNYTYTVTDLDNSCVLSPDHISPALELITPVDPQFEVDTTVPVTCFGNLDGKIIIKQIDNVDNLDVTYEYSLNGGTYQASNLFEGLAAGSYDVDIRSSKNCIQNLTGITIGGPTAPVTLSAAIVTAFTCTADNKLGMATIETTVSGGTAPYKYSYNGNSFSSITGTTISFDVPYKETSQSVTIDVIDANGCPTFVNATIFAATKVTASINVGQIMNCVDNAEIDVIPSGGVGPFQVRELPSGDLINGGTGTGTITIDRDISGPGTYVYELTDTDTGCTAQVTYEIAPFNTIEVVATKISDITCFGDSNGELSFEVSSFNTDFSYAIFNTNDEFTPIHTVPNSITTTAISYNLLPAGTFYVKARDNSTGCTKQSERISIQSPAEALDFTFDTTHELTCAPGNDAQVTATPTGGWGTYEFQLVDPSLGSPIQSFSANNVFSDLTSGINYELTVKDVNGCEEMHVINTIAAIAPITVDPVTISGATNPSCTGANDGSITVVVTGGKGPSYYQYILNNETTGVSGLPQNTGNSPTPNEFNDLLEGVYSVTVTDGYGCDTTTATIAIDDPSEIIIDGIITNELSCAPSTSTIIDTGEITVSASGGGGTYEYRIVSPVANATAWSTQQVYGSLAPGTYEFQARDSANLCVSPISVIRTINDIDDLTITVNSDNTIINCNGETDAVLIAEAAGSVGGYQYQLEVSGTLQGALQNSGTFENLGAGSYRILATSGINCEAYSEIIVIDQPAELIASYVKQDVKCYGANDGTIEVNIVSGDGPFQYIISSSPEKSVDTNIFDSLEGGISYTVIVQDANGCEFTINNIAIDSPAEALAANITNWEDEVCSSDDNGLIEVSITGGTAPYQYNLTGTSDPYSPVGSSTLLLEDLDGGIYQIYIKDANDCEHPVVLKEVKVGSDLTATVEPTSECIDGVPVYGATIVFTDTTLDTSEIVFDLDDATPNSPDVANAQADAIFTNITSGNHTISIVHLGTGCIEVKSFTIEQQDQLTLTTKPGGINEIILEATGGDGDYTYYFDDEFNSTGSMYINHTAVYVGKVIDGKGCETSIEIPMEFIDIEIPNFFTPDGDGNNDTWVFKNVEGFPDLWGAIYDRYGRQLKYFVKQGNWDGSYNNVDLPAGDYWYIIKLNGESDDREFVGNVTIYR